MATVAKDSQKRRAPENELRVRSMLALTASDTNELVAVPKGLYCSVAGNVKVMFADDSTAVTIAVVAGQLYPFEIRQLFSTGTTATVLACY